ncbi:MCE family protein [Mycolicibacterium elephantis]|uniref:MCE family protein n=1 Tax=Mycolicibacterium elephantis TaxID=81858 RepID=UPI0006298D2D|nr:MCE family protein [Mycolicibacterium elephantis]KKW62356.1 mammalian cell entry protein [Mycolicibacterium elephantis]OBA67239.1 mammalian cell entry protein [Mycolicibacterium elephantis]OBB24020.1 mammalian cell entry protein [Mycolicibacterium elephantis]
MMRSKVVATVAAAVGVTVAGCADWQGANSLPLPGTEGRGAGAYTVQAQLPDVDNIERNSRVRVGDVTVGNVTKIERQDWHALVTMSLNGDVQLPANATATVGQTSLLGSLHIELAPPTDVPPTGRLQDGSLIPLSSGSRYPSTEQALAAVSMVLNQGGIGNIHDITQALSTAFTGREDDLRSLIAQLDEFIGHTEDQTDDIIAATESLNGMVGQVADQRPVLDTALETLPDALTVLKDQRETLTEALDQLGEFSALAADSVNLTKESLIQELNHLGPVLKSLADAGPSLTRSLSFYSTFPWPKETISTWQRGDYANLSAVIDLTLSRLDSSFFTGTRFEGHLTELELQWGRTIGQLPSPYTAGNPLVVPYHMDQGR